MDFKSLWASLRIPGRLQVAEHGLLVPIDLRDGLRYRQVTREGLYVPTGLTEGSQTTVGHWAQSPHPYGFPDDCGSLGLHFHLK